MLARISPCFNTNTSAPRKTPIADSVNPVAIRISVRPMKLVLDVSRPNATAANRR
jgi:hypothetical protein